jgi:thiamine-phosphate pyrophosphorylase
MIQLREKDLSDLQLCELVSFLITYRAERSTLLIVNTRFDIAAATGVEGVHLSSQSLPIAKVRAACGQEFLVGKSVHSLPQAIQAEKEGADYLCFGPVFFTPSKGHYGSPQGIEKLMEVCDTVKVPVLAIGGITLETAYLALKSGAAGIAAIRCFQQPGSLKSLVEEMRQQCSSQ